MTSFRIGTSNRRRDQWETEGPAGSGGAFVVPSEQDRLA
jgi:hypothetical protein